MRVILLLTKWRGYLHDSSSSHVLLPAQRPRYYVNRKISLNLMFLETISVGKVSDVYMCPWLSVSIKDTCIFIQGNCTLHYLCIRFSSLYIYIKFDDTFSLIGGDSDRHSMLIGHRRVSCDVGCKRAADWLLRVTWCVGW